MAIYHGKTVLIAVFQGGASQIILKAFIFRSEFRGTSTSGLPPANRYIKDPRNNASRHTCLNISFFC